ncbi:hypothetical protein ABIA18_002733 [Sinorhizobium fredii]
MAGLARQSSKHPPWTIRSVTIPAIRRGTGRLLETPFLVPIEMPSAERSAVRCGDGTEFAELNKNRPRPLPSVRTAHS